MRILIIDDSEDSRDLEEGTLLSAGYDDVVIAASGWEALKVLDIGRNSDEPPSVDIVLLDVVMPDMDGVETCARIRNDPRCADLPIIMVTSRDDMETLSNAFVAGATDYVTKPVNRMELIARVRAALRLKAELDRRQAREHELLGFLSSWGNRRASLWIDEATGLFVGEVAEAYLTSAVGYESNDAMSIVAMTIDRLAACLFGRNVIDSAHDPSPPLVVLAQGDVCLDSVVRMRAWVASSPKTVVAAARRVFAGQVGGRFGLSQASAAVPFGMVWLGRHCAYLAKER